MQTYKGPGKTLTLAAPYDVASGAGALVGAIFGVAFKAVSNGDDGEFLTEGEFTLAKLSTDEWAVGQRLYWDNSNKRLDEDSTVGPFVAVALEVTANPSSTGRCKLVGPSEGAEGAQTAIADLTFGTNITAATANGALTDSSATNPTEAQFNELAKELGTKINSILASLRAAGVLKT
jgi:predicted RecA/RadA family phage recombinase